jgi:hypothetical protein
MYDGCGRDASRAAPLDSVTTDVHLSDRPAGFSLGAVWGYQVFQGPSVHQLHEPWGGWAYLSAGFDDVDEVRLGLSWSTPYHSVTFTRARIRGIEAEFLWDVHDGAVLLRGGPRLGWVHMKRDWWAQDGRHAAAGGAVLVALRPLVGNLWLEGRVALTGFLLIDPEWEGANPRRRQHAWVAPLQLGLRYGVR